MEILQKSTKLLRLVAGLLWLCASPAWAAGSAQLFESEVVVESQTPALRTAAMHTALEEVLVRVAGEAAVLQTEAARALLQKPSRLVQQYRYFTVPDSQPPILKLWVRFDGGAIQQSLQPQGQAYPGTQPADTLVWLAVNDLGRQYLVAADDETDVHLQTAAAARQRGLPVLFPLMDLEDQSRVRYADIEAGVFDPVLKASSRYSPQAILIGRLQRNPSGDWSARWDMDVTGTPAAWSDSHPQLAALLQQGMDAAAARFAGAGARDRADAISISVDGITSLAAYALVNDYLATLVPVAGYQVRLIDGSEVQYNLRLSGGVQDLTHTVAIGTVLEPVASHLPGYYRLRQ